MRLKPGITALAVCLSMAFTGCEVLEDILTGPGHPPHEHEAKCETVGAAVLVPLALIDVHNDPYRSTAAAIGGDVLCVDVEYGGGCAEHQFNLLVNTAIMESNPPRVQAMLTHNANNDPCDAYFVKKIGFDLTPLKERMREVTGQESGVVILHIAGSATEHTVEYKY